jgi:hypothetical protein
MVVISLTVAVLLTGLRPSLAAETAATTAGEPAAGKPEEWALHVKAHLGGSSVLVFSADQVQWLHKQGARPGVRDDTGDLVPAVIDGDEWEPQWISYLSTRHTLPVRVPRRLEGVDVLVKPIQVRGRLKLLTGPAAIIVDLDDTKSDGGDWYEFELRVGAVGTAPEDEAGLVRASPRVKRAAVADREAERSTFQVDMLADRRARAAAQERLSGQSGELQAAWLELGLAEARVQELNLRIQSAQSELQHWDQQVREAEEKVAEREREPRTMHGVTYTRSHWDYWYRVWTARLNDRREAQRVAQQELSGLQQELVSAEQSWRQAQGDYDSARRAHEAESARVYEEEFQTQREQVTAEAVEREAERKASISAALADETVAGRYTLVHNGRELGEVTLLADHSLTTLSGEKRADYQWETTEEGLRIRLRDVEWIFEPGPMDTLLGTCIGPYPELMGLKAMLRRVSADEGVDVGAAAG